MSPVTEQSAWHAHESHWPGRVDQPMEEIQILSTVVHQIAEGVLITDREGLIEYVNPAFERLTGYSRHEVLGRKPGILKSGRQDPAVYKKLWNTILAGNVYEGILVNRKKNGELYCEEKVITPIFDRRGSITHFVSSGRDISARRQEEENLRESERRLREVTSVRKAFYSMVVHDMNSPLATVVGSLELLRDEVSGILSPRQLEFLAMTLRNANRMRHLVSDLVDLSKLDTGTFSVVRVPIDIRECVRQCCLAFDGKLQSAGRRFVYPSESDFPLILNADADRLGQVLTNLLENAVRYAVSMVRVRLADGPSAVEISVENDGPQILNPDQIQRIFNVSVQFAIAGKSKGQSGLGLAIAKGIVEAHGGVIGVENIQSEEGAGVRFYVKLPKS